MPGLPWLRPPEEEEEEFFNHRKNAMHVAPGIRAEGVGRLTSVQPQCLGLKLQT